MSTIKAEDRAHQNHMHRALALAARGRGHVEPNPMVGAILVSADGERLLGEGYHQKFAGPHAERNALADAIDRDNGHALAGATLYVTLEPCCHQGKTPPCTDAILDARLARVVVAMTDPDEKVAGKGLAILREAGIEVITGVCEAEVQSLLAPYSKLRTQSRPWVIAKWAQTTDGYLALPGDAGPWITGPAAREHVHQVRAGCDGIVVGITTALADDPMLNNRSGQGRQPVRVVLDSQLRLATQSQLVATAQEFPTLLVTTRSAAIEKPQRVEAMRRHGVEILAMPEENGMIALPALLDELGRRLWTYLLIEGGAKVLKNALPLTDELLAYVAQASAGPGATKDSLPHFDLSDAIATGEFTEQESIALPPDTLLRFRRTAPSHS